MQVDNQGFHRVGRSRYVAAFAEIKVGQLLASPAERATGDYKRQERRGAVPVQ